MKAPFPSLPFKNEYFLLLLPLFFVFHGYAENHSLIHARDAITLFFFYCVVSFVLACCFFFLFPSWRKASLFVFCLLLIHFFFGSFHDGLKHILKESLLTKYSVLLVVILIIVGAAFYYLRKTARSFAKGVRYLNTLFVVLILLDGVMLLITLGKEQKDGLPLQLTPCTTCSTPDIYWIIADEYAGRQQLAEVFQYDNSPFENDLRSRGFHVVNNSRSNYNFTPFSIASTMNLSYLPLKDTGSTTGDVPMVMELVSKNALTQYLSGQGYQVFNHSVFDLPGEPRQVTSSFLPNKTKYITAQTLISRLERDLYYHLITSLKLQWIIKKGVYNNLRNNAVLYQNTVTTSALKTGPKFTYTHLSMPHPPYYYNEFGQPNPYDELVREDDKDYVGYLKYSNKKLLALVDQILKNSAAPPIIIVSSDHGLRSGAQGYHFMNLCAIYTPGKNYTPYYDGLSAVNMFRVLLREQFKQTLPLLEDRTYFLKD